MSEAVYNLENVNYDYAGKINALKNVCLTVNKGEQVAILGANGSGKSTLLKLLNALIFPSSGTIEAYGTQLSEGLLDDDKSAFPPMFRKNVGFVFQNSETQLFCPTVWDEILFGPLQLDIPRNVAEVRAKDVMDMLGISCLKDRAPYSLSGGEKKKVAIASVLSVNPEVLLLDEPTSNLDPATKRWLIELLVELKKAGKTIIIATHDLDYVPQITDRVYVLDKKIVAEGTPGEILLDIELLKKTNLETPSIAVLFEILRCFGYDCKDLPLSMDEAVTHLNKTLESGGGHVHLHMHEHTHEEIKDLKKRHGHHFP
jgi:cobalt/nickel transport system ATP-binding protein